MASKGTLWICTMTIIGIFLIYTGSVAADPEPCKNYQKIRDNDRSILSGPGTKCDRYLTYGWYRFYIDDESAIIPTQCIKPGFCGAVIGMHVNLNGASMPAEGETISAVACGSYSILDHWSCCALQQDIHIRHCPGNFYIYKLKPTDRCPVSYCTVKNSTNMESKVTVRHGYHISHVDTTVAEITTQQTETTESPNYTTGMNLDGIQTMEDETVKSTEMASTKETVTLPVLYDEKKLINDMVSSGSDEQIDQDTTQVSYEFTSSVLGKQNASTVQSVISATTTISVPITNKTTLDILDRKPAELIFLLNGQNREEVLASFHANFTAAMQKANRNIHNITVKEIYPINNVIKILFWAYDKDGNLIPGFRVEENMEMREKVEEALGLRAHPQRQDIFQEYLALFIILIIIGFLCLIILLSSCMYLYCRRHSGHWDRALAEQYHVTVVPRREARISENLYSDETIMSDEMLEKSHSSLGSHYVGVGNLHDLSYPNSLSGIKAMNNKNTFNTYPNTYGSLPKDGIEGLVVPIDQLKPEKDALIIEDTVL